MKFGVLICSDTCAADSSADISGPLLVGLLQADEVKLGAEIAAYHIVADELNSIREKLMELAPTCDVLLTVGGTGLAPRDVTPEATKSVIQRECNGIAVALITASLQKTPMAALTRLTAGIYERCLIVNLPGSPKAVRECFAVLEPILPHAVGLIKGDDTEGVREKHKAMAREE